MREDPYYLSRGKHRNPGDGRCAMEWVSYLAGESHSDSPDCVSTVLKAFCINLNDQLHAAERQKLRPYLARTIGTRGDGLDQRRSEVCLAWLVRVYAPAYLDQVESLQRYAEVLRDMSEELLLRSPDLAVAILDNTVVASRWTGGILVEVAVENVAKVVNCYADAGGDLVGCTAGDAARLAADCTNMESPAVKALVGSPLDLLDQMLPKEIIEMPVVEDWREVCEVVA